MKLSDFGIAKHGEEESEAGGVKGRFAYISPEQAINKGVSQKSDLYSLGMVLYELVVGHRLYSQLADFDALRSSREGKIRLPRKIDPNLPKSIDNFFEKMLAFEKRDRFKDANECASELRSIRYSLPDSQGVASKQISAILARFVQKAEETRVSRMVMASPLDESEPTVVKIATAVGFPSEFALPARETPMSAGPRIGGFGLANSEFVEMGSGETTSPHRLKLSSGLHSLGSVSDFAQDLTTSAHVSDGRTTSRNFDQALTGEVLLPKPEGEPGSSNLFAGGDTLRSRHDISPQDAGQEPDEPPTTTVFEQDQQQDFTVGTGAERKRKTVVALFAGTMVIVATISFSLASGWLASKDQTAKAEVAANEKTSGEKTDAGEIEPSAIEKGADPTEQSAGEAANATEATKRLVKPKPKKSRKKHLKKPGKKTSKKLSKKATKKKLSKKKLSKKKRSKKKRSKKRSGKKTSAKKTSAKKTSGKKTSGKKTSGKKTSGKKTSGKKSKKSSRKRVKKSGKRSTKRHSPKTKKKSLSGK